MYKCEDYMDIVIKEINMSKQTDNEERLKKYI